MFKYKGSIFYFMKYEMIIGIPSYNEEDNIAYVAESVDKGLQKYFPDKKALIINCDGGSKDKTKDNFLAANTKTEKMFIQAPEGTTGKGTVFNMLFGKVKEFDASSVMVVDADIMSKNLVDWVSYLVQPVVDGFDYVTPLYSRHKYDGTITNNICFPLVYGLLGKDIRQPIGGDFAFSGRLAKYWLEQKWVDTTYLYGIDIFMTTNAIFGGFKTVQSGLGAKIHKPSAPKLGPMFLQVVGTLFENIILNKDKWVGAEVEESKKAYGIELEEPQDLEVDRDKTLQQSLDVYDGEKLKEFLSPEVFEQIDSMFKSKKIDITADLWVKVVYDMVVAFSKASDKEAVVESMKALYFGRTYSFMNQTWEMSSKEAEKEILKQAEKFRENKGYLIERLE